MAQDYYKHATSQLNIHVKNDSKITSNVTDFPVALSGDPFTSVRFDIDGIGVDFLIRDIDAFKTLLEQTTHKLTMTQMSRQHDKDVSRQT